MEIWDPSLTNLNPNRSKVAMTLRIGASTGNLGIR